MNHEGMLWRLWGKIGLIPAALAALGAFVFAWWTAIKSWGWLLGISFGWVPSVIVAVLAFAAAWIVWFLLPLALALGVLWWVLWGRRHQG